MKFTDILVKPVQPDKLIWSTYFPEYLVQRPNAFVEHVAEQEHRIETLIRGMGLGSNSLKVLEGLEPAVPLARHWVGLLKAPATVEALKGDLKSGKVKRLVVLGRSKPMLTEIREGLREFGAVAIWPGSAPYRVARWQREFISGKQRVLCANMTAAAALNCLSATHEYAIVEWDWNADVNKNALIRARARQAQPLNIRCFMLEGSYDHRVSMAVRNRTRKLIEQYDDFLR